jgi:RNA methyltransferase, TrmH family
MITSARNPNLRELRKLRERKHREQQGAFLAEGEDMLSEALHRGALPKAVFFDPDAPSVAGLIADLPDSVPVTPVRADALETAGTLGSGSRVIGVWSQRWADLPAARQRGVAVYLHEVADPGNVGAVVRAALALVPSTVILSPGAADPFGPKAVRASMGSIFGQPIVRASFEAARAALGESRRALAMVPRAGDPLREVAPASPILFCLGAERSGLPDSIVSACDGIAHVPLRGAGAESLNVAMTATLCLYETAVHTLSRPMAAPTEDALARVTPVPDA